jgi:clathrin heavy chain
MPSSPPPPQPPPPQQQHNTTQYIEVYVQRVSPPKTPQVVGKLLDLDCNEDFVRMLLQSVGAACPVEELVEQVRDCFA